MNSCADHLSERTNLTSKLFIVNRDMLGASPEGSEGHTPSQAKPLSFRPEYGRPPQANQVKTSQDKLTEDKSNAINARCLKGVKV
jgi:hypothetical protein